MKMIYSNTRKIANGGLCRLLKSLTLVVILSSLTVFAKAESVKVNDGSAFSKIMMNNPNLTAFEILVKAFEESANKQVIYKWKNVGKRSQEAYLLNSNDLMYNLYWPERDSSFDERLGEGGYIKLSRNSKGPLVGDFDLATPSIYIFNNNENSYISKYIRSDLKLIYYANSLKTEEDFYDSPWEIRQYNNDIIILARLPNINGICNYQSDKSPVHGYCMIGYMFTK